MVSDAGMTSMPASFGEGERDFGNRIEVHWMRCPRKQRFEWEPCPAGRDGSRDDALPTGRSIGNRSSPRPSSVIAAVVHGYHEQLLK